MKAALEERRKTYVTVEEAALRCNRSERTIRRWIQQKIVHVDRNKQFRSVRIDQDDLDRICAQRPDTVHPVRGEIASLKSHEETLEQRIDRVAQLVAQLAQRIDLLEERALAGGESSYKHQSPRITRTSGAESRGLPSGTLRLAHFASQHRVVMSQIKSLYYDHQVDLVRHQREGDPIRNKQEWWITPEQQEQLIRYWQEHSITYTACGQCQGCVELAQNNEID